MLWDIYDTKDFNEDIQHYTYHDRYIDFGSNLKFYENAMEFHEVFLVMIHVQNIILLDVLDYYMNKFIKKAQWKCIINEMTWSNSSEAISRIRAKPDVNKCGQKIVLLALQSWYIHAW